MASLQAGFGSRRRWLIRPEVTLALLIGVQPEGRYAPMSWA